MYAPKLTHPHPSSQMNQIPFKEYKDQVFNPGSPTPQPSVDPLKKLPKIKNTPSISSIFDKKTNLPTRNTKRKLDNMTSPTSEPSEPSAKIQHTESMAQLITLLKTNQEEQKLERESEFKKQMSHIDKALADQQSNTANLISDFRSEVQGCRADVQILTERLDNLESLNIDTIKEQLIPEIEHHIAQTLKSTENSRWDETCAANVKAESMKLCISGLPPSPNPIKTTVKKFCTENLGLTPEQFSHLDIKDCYSLGKPKPDDTKTRIMIIFGNLQSRNTCLKNRNKLPNGLWISTQVPKIYIEKNKEFEEQAKNLRLTENVATRIEFDGPMIQLKYGLKPSDKEMQIMYKIFDEWKPKPQIIHPKQPPPHPSN